MNNKQLNFLQKLSQKKYRDEHQKFLIANPKVIWEEYDNPLLDSVYVTDNFYKENEDRMVFPKLDRISEADMKKLSGQVSPSGIVALFDMPKVKKFNARNQYILLLESIQDPGNMGTIIRTADWFGFKDVFLSTDCVDVFNPKVVAASMGSIFNVNIYSDQNLIDLTKDLKKQRYQVIVTDLMGGEFKNNKKSKSALVIGNESKGVSPQLKELANLRFKIKKSGQAESLNAAVAAGIVMEKMRF